MRKLGQNERDEDVVGVLRLGTRIGRQERGLGLGANGSRLAVGLEHGRTGDRLDGEILGRPGLEPGAYRLLIGRGRDDILSFEGAKYTAVRALRVALPFGLIEEQRRPIELVEDEQQGAEQKDEELHRNLQERIEHQTEAAFAQ